MTKQIEKDIKKYALADKKHSHIPSLDKNYHLDPHTSEIILAGFAHNRRVIVQGFHGTGKSTHIEQIAARLNWPLVRVNLDGHVSRVDLIGRDAITLKDGKQVTEFIPGIIPWAMQEGVALLFDEYDAARADVLFVIQRLLESEGKLTLLDQNQVITPHKNFRLFATANTIGLGDSSGIYHGTNPINQGQMDRWHMVATLNYLPAKEEEKIVLSKLDKNQQDTNLVKQMVNLANLTREGFKQGSISTVMSPRTVISWIENYYLLNENLEHAFKASFLNKCDEHEKQVFSEYYQRVFDVTL